jgi:hypothetical protein
MSELFAGVGSRRQAHRDDALAARARHRVGRHRVRRLMELLDCKPCIPSPG